MRNDTPARRAVVAFLFHGPGLVRLTTYRLSAALLRVNVAALVATLVASAAAAALCPGRRGLAAIGAFTVGHFAWSTYLAARVHRETTAVIRGGHHDDGGANAR